MKQYVKVKRNWQNIKKKDEIESLRDPRVNTKAFFRKLEILYLLASMYEVVAPRSKHRKTIWNEIRKMEEQSIFKKTKNARNSRR